MASYHFSAQAVKRSEGRSVVAMAAYRAGERLKDERRGMDVDFSRRRRVVHAEILAPEGAAEWLLDRETLWNAVERMETRRDAQLAREINMALPHELSADEQLALVRAFVLEHFVALGMVADIAIHAPVIEKGDDPRNFHAHVLLTMRQAGGGGLRRVKTREWNSDKMLARWRAAWSEHQNQALERKGLLQRVDHRSLAVQRKTAVERGDRVAAATLARAPEIHVGPKARKASRKQVPKSKARPVGRNLKKGKRPLRYDLIDRGSRREWNMRTLQANAKAFSKMITRTEAHRTRMRERLDKYERLLRLQASPVMTLRMSRGHPIEPGLPSFHSVRHEHVRKRRDETLWIIDQLDRIFLALLGIRESQLTRHTMWANRLRWRRTHLLAPVPGPGRFRSRLLPS
ncbi:MobQ family relaxase [Bradyrhizobium diazoefficiens]|uniref:MobQ family relaxase n=1 Tax=Bradyrhizobium diazoefficiens TaxID=1355477 RepID=UPI000D72C4F8|nr:MobQ family relaxase [Bradyrhizobium diazoefficiens]AWO92419.1 MobA/MobL family protein [Bradyrhizobium diazoefficiens]